MNCYVMSRTGKFKPKRMTSNQCRGKGHPDYHYKVNVVFSPNAELDKNSFLIDHQEIDDCVQKCKLVGSCETMHIAILEELRSMFGDKDIPVIGIRSTIFPVLEGGSAVLSYTWISPRKSNMFHSILPLLMQ